MNTVRETICTKCKNRVLCKFVDKFINTQIQVDGISVEFPHEITLKCQYHTIDTGNIR